MMDIINLSHLPFMNRSQQPDFLKQSHPANLGYRPFIFSPMANSLTPARSGVTECPQNQGINSEYNTLGGTKTR
jgi:hypothetical protein